MNVLTMAMPGALRMRSLYPLVEGDGSCSLLYDLERSTVLDVPEELQLHVAAALDTGDLDEAVWAWMLAADLLTAEDWPQAEAAEPGAVNHWQSLGLLFRRDREVHARLDGATAESAPKTLDFVFKQSFGVGRVTLRLSWGGAFPSPEVLDAIVVEANRRAVAGGLEVRFELSLDAWEVTPEVAAYLAGFPVEVRLDCGTFAADCAAERAWRLAEAGVRRLAGLGDRLTVRCALDGDARLRDLWSWAQRSGVGRLDPWLTPESDALRVLRPRLRRYLEDLQAIAAEISAGLESGRPPGQSAQGAVECLPLTRVVQRLLGREPFLAPRRSTEALPCHGCWARALCSHSLLRGAAERADADPHEPSEERCTVWRAEVELGLRLSHRLAHLDPPMGLHLFDEPDLGTEALGRSI